MAPIPIKVGHIDDVQELRKFKPSEIPRRFVRDPSERPRPATTIIDDSSTDTIPVIDLSKLLNGGNDFQAAEISKLAASCQEWGFFQVINHGIDVDLLERIEKVATEFFMLPVQEKLKYPMSPGTVQGYGQAFVFSEDQKLDWCNMFALGLHPHYIRNPTLWPSNPSDFSQTLEDYSRDIRKLCKNLLKFIAITLNLNENAFDEPFGDAVQAARMNYYPPCPRPDLVLGLSPHSDGSGLTVLQQAGNYCNTTTTTTTTTAVVGLQILKDNKWVPINPIRNALVVNIGDTIEVLTNGKYKSVEHRAVTNKEKDRLSIVTFYAPGYDRELGPLKDMVDDQNPCKYRRYNHGDYSKHYVTNKLQGKKSLDFAKVKIG